MKHHFDVPGQRYLFKIGGPKRRKPTPDELAAALKKGAEIAISKWHRGGPLSDSFTAMVQEIIVQALPRMRNFRHGGTKTLNEFAYMSCYFALRETQRSTIKRLNEMQRKPQSYPLFDRAY